MNVSFIADIVSNPSTLEIRYPTENFDSLLTSELIQILGNFLHEYNSEYQSVDKSGNLKIDLFGDALITSYLGIYPPIIVFNLVYLGVEQDDQKMTFAEAWEVSKIIENRAYNSSQNSWAGSPGALKLQEIQNWLSSMLN